MPKKTVPSPVVVDDLETIDFVVNALKKRYFEVVSLEKYPNTPELTKEADYLEKEIVKIQLKK